jgi:DNA phosphorothioation-dependent restriction protein DptG
MNREKNELLNLLSQLSDIYPEMRLGQLVTNVAQWAKGPTNSATWDVTDQEMIQAVKLNIEHHGSGTIGKK